MSKLSEKAKDLIFNAAPSLPQRRQEVLKSDGWGYRDTEFVLSEGGSPGTEEVSLRGARYGVADGGRLPGFVAWMRAALGAEGTEGARGARAERVWREEDLPGAAPSPGLVAALARAALSLSLDPADRVFRGHGHTVAEVFALQAGRCGRVPDLVCWPRSHHEVHTAVLLAKQSGAVVIPFGGGTSVTKALVCSPLETRTILSLDLSQMNKILWLDEANMTVRIEAGIVGKDMETRLALLGYCVGHEPDSYEFSSLGGWVATRASGMKKNIYGNIEDLVVHVTMVTTEGVLQKDCQGPRVSLGPDVHHFILGSEGTLGVITEVTLKIRKLPKFKKYGSIIFPDFESGFNCLREIARQKIFPASIRLMDNEQFHFGLAMKSRVSSVFKKVLESVKKLYLLSYKGYDQHKLCVATLLMEGDCKKTIIEQEKKLLSIASVFKGISGGEENGKRGYLLTFVIAYIRDLALEHNILAESFETSVPWDKTLALCSAVKEKVVSEGKRLGVMKPIFISCRITQLYDAGVCVYFYLALNYNGMNVNDAEVVDPVDIYEEVETAARDEILNMGGSLSHHHGVGKIRSKWLERVISPAGLTALRSVKKALDPDNVFANGALFSLEPTAKL